MNTTLMEYIIAIAENRSISAAAEQFLISPAALTIQLKKLESELGTELFKREHHKMILTDAGKIYINSARQILSIYQEAVKQIRNYPEV